MWRGTVRKLRGCWVGRFGAGRCIGWRGGCPAWGCTRSSGQQLPGGLGRLAGEYYDDLSEGFSVFWRIKYRNITIVLGSSEYFEK